MMLKQGWCELVLCEDIHELDSRSPSWARSFLQIFFRGAFPPLAMDNCIILAKYAAIPPRVN